MEQEKDWDKLVVNEKNNELNQKLIKKVVSLRVKKNNGKLDLKSSVKTWSE